MWLFPKKTNGSKIFDYTDVEDIYISKASYGIVEFIKPEKIESKSDLVEIFNEFS